MTADPTAPTSSTAHFVIAPPPVVALPVRGTDALFPVRRIYCVGRNYAAHAVEMGHDPDKEAPFFFQKNPDNLTSAGSNVVGRFRPDGAETPIKIVMRSVLFPYPVGTSDVHHEVELVVALHKGGESIPVESALTHVFGYAVGIDMTRRDLQAEAKKAGRPWEVAKAFEHSAPCGPLVPAAEIGHPTAGAITLTVNGELRQKGDLNQLIWKVPEVIAYLSALFTLAPGDLIFTGTPSGVGAVARGSVMLGQVDGVGNLEVAVV